MTGLFFPGNRRRGVRRGHGARVAKARAMKTLLRLIFGRRKKAGAEFPFLRFYLTEFNTPGQARRDPGVRL